MKEIVLNGEDSPSYEENPGREELRFSISETARFFDKSVPWLRWKESIEAFKNEDGEPLQIERTSSNFRRYSLRDIELMAQSLYRDKKISKEAYNNIAKRVNAFS